MENCSAACTATYRFVLLPGNNHPVIRRALQKRKNWHEASQSDILSAQFIWTPLNLPTQSYRDLDDKVKYEGKSVLINHFENNSVITTKSGLLRSLRHFYTHSENIYHNGVHVFESVPTTFIVQAHNSTQDFKSFAERFNELERKCYTKEKVPEKHCKNNVWIVKPEAMNQGRGIELFRSVKDIESFLATKPVNSNWIIQKCIERPLLYNGRKFDIRMWVLVTPQFEIYYYKKAYMRTSSYDYDPCRLEQVVQLTNNCFQKKTQQYQKFEDGNTLPISRLAQFLTQQEEYKDFAGDIEKSLVERMKELILSSLLCARKHLYKQKRQKQFQLFGYDFLVDEDLRTWLIQVNNNPYLGTPNSYMKSLVPLMIDEMFNLVLDNLFPPEVPHEIAADDRQFCLIYSEPVAVRRLKNEHSLTKNYYPIPLLEAKPNQVIKIGKTEELPAATDRDSKMKYMSPTESIRQLLENYCYSDFEPFQLPVTLLLGSNKLNDPNLLQANLKSLKLITDTRINVMLAQPKFIEICKKILCGCYPNKIKLTILQGYRNCAKYARTRKRIIEFVLPEINKFFFEANSKVAQLQNDFVTLVVKLCINLAGSFQRKVFVPGETRQNEFVREFFIRHHGLHLINLIAKNFPDLCKEEISVFLSNLQEKDWQIFKEMEKGNSTSDDWQKKYRGSSILRDEGRERRSLQTQQMYSPELDVTRLGIIEHSLRTTRAQTSVLARHRKSVDSTVRPSLPAIRK